MKKILTLTFVFVAVPSFLMLTSLKEEEKLNVKEEIITNNTNDNDIEIKVLQTKKNKIIILNIEDYVKGVVAGEMPISFELEALKAQAVAARTYALRRINYNNEYDVVDTVMNQVYKDEETLKREWGSNYEKYINKINSAVNETRGEYVDYNGTYADTLFFSTSVGITENSEEIFGTKLAYLQSVSSNWDEEVSPVYEEKNTFTRKEFCDKLSLKDCSKIYVNILEETSTGRIKKLSINNKIFTGTNFSYLLGVRSNYFSIYIENNNVIVKTKGFGHGVGMSQYGAEGMSLNGYNYKDIIEHYYQGTSLKNLNA